MPTPPTLVATPDPPPQGRDEIIAIRPGIDVFTFSLLLAALSDAFPGAQMADVPGMLAVRVPGEDMDAFFDRMMDRDPDGPALKTGQTVMVWVGGVRYPARITGFCGDTYEFMFTGDDPESSGGAS